MAPPRRNDARFASARAAARRAAMERPTVVRPRRSLDRQIHKVALWALPTLSLLTAYVIHTRVAEPPSTLTARAAAAGTAGTDAVGIGMLRDVCRVEPRPRRDGLTEEAQRFAGSVLQGEAMVVAQAETLACLMERSPRRLCQPEGVLALLEDIAAYEAPRREHARALAALQRSGAISSGRTRTAELVAEADGRVVRALDKLIEQGFLKRTELGRARLPAELTEQLSGRTSTEKPCG